jgi:hypothetical protein
MVEHARGNGKNGRHEPARRVVRFAMGRIVATPGALRTIDNQTIIQSLARHARGDWGDMDAEDKALNDLALKNGGRLVSRYPAKSGEPFWIITEADRSATTVLLPEEY